MSLEKNEELFNEIMKLQTVGDDLRAEIQMKGDTTSAFLGEMMKDVLGKYSGARYISEFNPTEKEIDALELSEKAKNEIKAYIGIAINSQNDEPGYNLEVPFGSVFEAAPQGGSRRKQMRRNRKTARKNKKRSQKKSRRNHK
jgi:hypothetical protein